ncbi:MAG: hypothetical protein EBR23_09870 [Planctomycetia bacterium]|nr:hypothetical protein [Planctomycetia bacterium]
MFWMFSYFFEGDLSKSLVEPLISAECRWLFLPGNVSKYTVYHDVVILSPEGDILLRLDGSVPGTKTARPAWWAAPSPATGSR